MDSSLLTYFDVDATTMKTPGAEDIDVLDPDDDLGMEDLALDERDADLPLAERRQRDPDGRFAWQDGVLSGPVRRHDYRLFLVTPADPE